MTARDINGREIVAGDYVLYAALWGRCATMKYGRVTRFDRRKPSWKGDDGPKATTVKVVSADRESIWSARDPNEPWRRPEIVGVRWVLQNDGREVTLGFPERMVVLPPELVPDDVRELLGVA